MSSGSLANHRGGFFSFAAPTLQNIIDGETQNVLNFKRCDFAEPSRPPSSPSCDKRVGGALRMTA
jgi:hypothetical protein